MTLKELAKELNVSPTTISRVLTGQEKKYRISAKTAEKVRAAAEAYQFSVNQVARNLRLQKTNTIGLVIPFISYPFFANLARTVEEDLRNREKMVLLCDTKDETQLEKESIDLLLARKVDGLLVVPVGETADHLSKNPKLPLVLIDRYFADSPIPYVSTDNYAGAHEAPSLLITKGHQKIACIQGLVHTTVNKDRVKGFVQALNDYQLAESECPILGNDYSIENGYQSAKALLQREDRPTAIFALSNQIAVGVMKAVNEMGLSIPEDISLLSFDEQSYFELLSTPLTAIQQPMQGIGQKAVEMLFQLFENKTVENSELKPRLIERSSIKSMDQLP